MKSIVLELAEKLKVDAASCRVPAGLLAVSPLRHEWIVPADSYFKMTIAELTLWRVGLTLKSACGTPSPIGKRARI